MLCDKQAPWAFCSLHGRIRQETRSRKASCPNPTINSAHVDKRGKQLFQKLLDLKTTSTNKSLLQHQLVDNVNNEWGIRQLKYLQPYSSSIFSNQQRWVTFWFLFHLSLAPFQPSSIFSIAMNTGQRSPGITEGNEDGCDISHTTSPSSIKG